MGSVHEQLPTRILALTATSPSGETTLGLLFPGGAGTILSLESSVGAKVLADHRLDDQEALKGAPPVGGSRYHEARPSSCFNRGGSRVEVAPGVSYTPASRVGMAELVDALG